MGFCVPSGFSQRLLQKYASCWLNERPGPPLSDQRAGVRTPQGGRRVTHPLDSTNPNATRGDSWCRHYALAASRLVPLHPGATRLARGLAAMLEPADLQVAPPDGLRTPDEAARKLGCSVKTLNAHVAAGDLRYVIIGKGTKRPHRMYAAADLDDFIANQTRKDSPACRSIASRARRSSTSNSASEVIAFSAQPRPRPGAKRKK
jgi:hypothetical protein